jgi:hypothetical protein
VKLSRRGGWVVKWCSGGGGGEIWWGGDGGVWCAGVSH